MELKQVLILGNGSSRLFFKDEIRRFPSEIWVCNFAFSECDTLPQVSKVCTVHKEIIEEAQLYRKEHNYNFLIISKEGNEADEFFTLKKGWSSGSLAIAEAYEREYDRIYLAGFDMGGIDIYHKLPREGSNFKKQFDKLISIYNADKLFFIKNGITFEGGKDK